MKNELSSEDKNKICLVTQELLFFAGWLEYELQKRKKDKQ